MRASSSRSAFPGRRGNPNAYLFMGLIFQEKAANNDVLKHTEILISNLDSAMIFYDKSYKQLTEKEIKKNDEYYQAYNRRDLRTGKFGVTLSDVQFDLEKRIELLKERQALVKELRANYDKAESYYSKANFLFKDLQIKYSNLKTLYLRSDENTVADLKRIANIFDSSLVAFKSYKSVSQKLGKTGHNQELAMVEISDFEKDGESPADFMQDRLELWNYRRWTETIVTGIEREVIPMWDNLNAYDIKINRLREKIKNDSISVKDDLRMLVDIMINAQLKKYDPNPLPMDIFGMKIAELEYLSSTLIHNQFKDSADMKLQVTLTKNELTELNKLDSLTEKLSSRNLEEDAKDYNHFIVNAYGNQSVLKSLIRTTRDFAEREKKRKQNELNNFTEAMRWIVLEKDSIPLFKEVNPDSKYVPLILVDEKYTAGFQFADSTATGYFMTINPARTVGLSANFPIDTANFSRRKLPVTKALSTSDENGQVFYVLIYSQEKVTDKFPVILAKIYLTDGLAWCSNFSFELVPSELSFQVQSGEVSIKTSNPAGESKMIFVDKNGKRKDLPK